MNPDYRNFASRTEIDHIRESNRNAKRRSRARQRQKQNEELTVSNHGDRLQYNELTVEVPAQEPEAPIVAPDWVQTAQSPIASEGYSSTSTFELDHESSAHIYHSPSATHTTPPDQLLNYLQIEDNGFVLSSTTNRNDLDPTSAETSPKFTTSSPNTASHHCASLYTIYQQPVDVDLHRRSPESTRRGSSTSGLLHLAVRNGSKAIAQALLTAGSNVNSYDESGTQPLHLAVQHRQKSMVDLLLSYGANPDAENAAGITPLEMAVRSQDEDIVRLLILRGARVT
ncbi:ankyrin repeat-containing domain protein [Xylaria curta]|nr:ankyrin repeat-containing domain protein [Xylaria curta]